MCYEKPLNNYYSANHGQKYRKRFLLFDIYVVSIILLFGLINIQRVKSVFGTSGRGLQSSNYLTVSRSTLKSGNVITLIPQGWLNRALKGVRTGTAANISFDIEFFL